MIPAVALLVLPALAAAAGLHELSVAAGKRYFGSATDNHELDDADYVAILSNKNEFGQITVGNKQKWQFTEPSQGQFNYDLGDVIVDLAEENGQSVWCHTLLWHSQLPSWVSDAPWTPAELTSIIETHISNVVGHYRGRCYAWDVINEVLEEDGSYRNSVFYRVLGPSFVPIAFNASRAADPAAKLYYNDFNLEYPGAKQNGVYNIISTVQDAGARIDGIGFQAHLVSGNTPSRATLTSVLNGYLAAGVTEVAYTELDIRITLPSTTESRQQQVTDYLSVVGSCLDVDACVGVTLWDYTDRYSWVPAVFTGQGEALLYDENLQKKPVWTSVSSLLAAAATNTPRCR